MKLDLERISVAGKHPADVQVGAPAGTNRRGTARHALARKLPNVLGLAFEPLRARGSVCRPDPELIGNSPGVACASLQRVSRHATSSGEREGWFMRVLRHLLMILVMLSMGIHPALAHVHHEAGAPTAHVHEHHHAASVSDESAAGVGAAHHQNCPMHHGGKCCDMACCASPCFSAVMGSGPSVRFSRPSAMPIPVGDLCPDDIALGLPDRPPIAA